VEGKYETTSEVCWGSSGSWLVNHVYWSDNTKLKYVCLYCKSELGCIPSTLVSVCHAKPVYCVVSGLRGWWWPWHGVGAVTTSGVCGSVVAWAGSGQLREVEVQKLRAKVQPGYCRPAVAAPKGVVLLLKAPLWSLLRLPLASGQALRVKA
jgi:hypothetical protein